MKPEDAIGAILALAVLAVISFAALVAVVAIGAREEVRAILFFKVEKDNK
jgi:hypothetical protein